MLKVQASLLLAVSIALSSQATKAAPTISVSARVQAQNAIFTE
jgi:hypothetical protein